MIKKENSKKKKDKQDDIWNKIIEVYSEGKFNGSKKEKRRRKYKIRGKICKLEGKMQWKKRIEKDDEGKEYCCKKKKKWKRERLPVDK